MALPEPDFISMQEATTEFNVSIERLRWLIAEGHIFAYFTTPGVYRMYDAEYRGYVEDPHQYTKARHPTWDIDTLTICTVEIMDKQLNPLKVEKVMYAVKNSYETIMINRAEFIALAWEPKSLENILIAELDETGRPIINNDAAFHQRLKTTVVDQENLALIGECMERDRRKIQDLEDFKLCMTHAARSGEPHRTCNEPVPETANKQEPQETDKELVERLKQLGWANKQIAQELRRVFPTISTYKIGVLLPANPGATIEKGSIGTQGRRLLK